MNEITYSKLVMVQCGEEIWERRSSISSPLKHSCCTWLEDKASALCVLWAGSCVLGWLWAGCCVLGWLWTGCCVLGWLWAGCCVLGWLWTGCCVLRWFCRTVWELKGWKALNDDTEVELALGGRLSCRWKRGGVSITDKESSCDNVSERVNAGCGLGCGIGLVGLQFCGERDVPESGLVVPEWDILSPAACVCVCVCVQQDALGMSACVHVTREEWHQRVSYVLCIDTPTHNSCSWSNCNKLIHQCALAVWSCAWLERVPVLFHPVQLELCSKVLRNDLYVVAL